MRVLCYWRDRVQQPLNLLQSAANDDAPRVRLEAVRALSFFEGRRPLELAHEILKHDTDYYLVYTFNETLRQLQQPGSPPFLPQHPLALARVLAASRRISFSYCSDEGWRNGWHDLMWYSLSHSHDHVPKCVYYG